MVRHLLFAVLVPCTFAVPLRAQTLEERVKSLEERASAAPPSFAPAAAPMASNSAFNPAMGMAFDTVVRSVSDKGQFQFRAAELSIEAPVDPHAKAWAVITGAPDAVSVEEATIQTTGLPWNLTVRGGRIFTVFGRLAHFHDHELPVVDRPTSLDTFIGGEARGDGLETTWLAPLPFFADLTLGAYNRLGANNTRTTDDPRAADELTYLGKVHTALELGDHTVDLGVSSAWTPKRRMVEDVTVTGSPNRAISTARNTQRQLNGVDLTYRWQPSEGGIYKGLLWSVEAMQNDERFFDPTTRLPRSRERAWGGFSYLQFKLGRHWRPGVLVDVTQDPQAPKTRRTKTFAGYLTYDITEFNRLRLEYARKTVSDAGRRLESTVALQWSVIIGHHVHGFRDR